VPIQGFICRAVRLSRRLARASTGAAAVEFAILSIPVIATLVFGLQLAIVTFYGQVVQNLADQAARQLMVGAPQLAGNASTANAFSNNVVCPLAAGVLPCSSLVIDVQQVASFNQLNTAPVNYATTNGVLNTPTNYPNTWAPSQVIMLRILYNYPLPFSPWNFGLRGSNGGAELQGTAVVQVEPYL